tara:strand:+ start:9453 stop:9818 length:366 start_codon:yes stop_codon:yes gene_type:complete
VTDDISNIIEMIIRMGEKEIEEKLLTQKNIEELEYINQVLLVMSNPNYEKGMHEYTDELIKASPINIDFLKGLRCGILMSLSLDPFTVVPNVTSMHHNTLHEIYCLAKSIQIELEVDACDM